MIVRILVLFTVSFPATWCIAQPAPAPSQQEPERIQSLNAVRIRVESRLRDLDNEIRQLQVKLGIDGGVVSSLGVKEIELSARVRQRIRAEIGAARARDAYERLVKALQEKQDPPELAAAGRNDNYVRELRRRVDDLEIRRDVLASKGTTGAHPQATELQAEI